MFSPSRTYIQRLPLAGLLLASFLSLLLAACGTPGSGSTSTSTTTAVKPSVAAPTDLVTPGTLLVGSDTTYTPMEFVDTKTNSYVGFDIDLIKAIGARMGLKVVIQKTSFDTIFDDLRNKRFDVVISSVTINDKRKQTFDFVPYFNAGESLLVPKGNPKNLKTVADLCGLNIGVQTGTVEKDDLDAGSKDCTKAGKPTIKQTVLQSQTDVIQLLSNGRVDATYQDSPVTDYYNKLNPGQFEVGGSVVNAAPYGITIRKGDTSMLNGIQKSFDAVKSDGTYNNLFKTWGFSDQQKVSYIRRQESVA
ncbi:ABC transporter substrate-binding protein [Dictyobacter kobayashii]|uniref:ABC transporter substrate-binding protein n=1 Tax=Dictyobacter kobayashii TaxID=2014872 RepID=A0A402AGG8_9CHLR|nr:ABC transporter substrate-binding protein [Dictyobacter kobayashii]GCE18202.1 ABC transporter substrate-binding protein [Dictyobacter kobayashii]